MTRGFTATTATLNAALAQTKTKTQALTANLSTFAGTVAKQISKFFAGN